VVDEHHFFVKLAGAIDWTAFTRKLMKLYKGGGEYGPPPYDPALILRMLLVSYLYHISERQTEEFVRYFLPAKYFVGLGVDQLPPDHSSLTVFKDRLLAYSGQKAVESLFDEIIRQAKKRHIRFGSLQIIDSTHTQADVNPGKDQDRQTRDGKPPRDSDAAWGVKRVKPVRDKHGVVRQIPETFFGYKIHASVNHQADLVTSLMVTTGSAYDGARLPSLVNKDLRKGLPVAAVTADKSYDDGDLIWFLEDKNILPAIAFKKTRTAPKWRQLQDNPDYQAAVAKRKHIERLFGEAKLHHGLNRCRYLTKHRTAIQAYFTFMAMNLKRLVKHFSQAPPSPALAYAMARGPT
jgi:IS5 family transposase